jgi:hypothetical protein
MKFSGGLKQSQNMAPMDSYNMANHTFPILAGTAVSKQPFNAHSL